MNEVKPPRNRLIYFYIILMVFLILINLFAIPSYNRHQIKEVDYSEFITATEDKQIDKVQIQENKIIFSKKNDDTFYETGKVEDPQLIDRLHNAGVQFTGEIVEETSPWATALLSWVLPILIILLAGHFLRRNMENRMG